MVLKVLSRMRVSIVECDNINYDDEKRSYCEEGGLFVLSSL